ncbi:metallophosphoesterase family protein [Hansschlegelia plantiphila]|uniref:Metallophosphoesterase n=1 Tax=Hansschlegelia plantiphila TaxID=374655 RepID=A0A9W6J3X7_9HYPH|nr:metallophosphoesterase [Hansschlegelia plantiphila]GLK69318.1 metallophosphoesterase [Hansschlegelia plantiphila]
MTVIAHLSDPHLGPLPRFTPFDLMSKRGLGAINYFRRRRRWHDMAVLDRLVADVLDEAPDAVAVTGDLTNLGLEAEFLPAAVFLGKFGPADKVAAIPGNHDAYVRTVATAPARVWGAHMSSDDGRIGFPFVRRHGQVALIGLSSAVPTWPLAATGEVGAAQRDALGPLLESLKAEGLFRIVLVHHPVAEDGTPWMRRLRDAAELREIIAREGAELVLHGHNHEPARAEIAGPERPVPVIAVPSCSTGVLSHEPLAAYNLYSVGGQPGAWACEVVTRGFTRDGSIAETDRYALY